MAGNLLGLEVTAEHVAQAFLHQIGLVFAAKGVEMRCDPVALQILQSNMPPALVNTTQDATKIGVIAATSAQLSLAQESDWYAEYLAPVISIKVVPGLDEAIAHINRYSSHHTDAILTRDHMHAQRFLREGDSASVMVNTSTRFADGFEYGLGAEIGISTDKFHARGPVGIEGLTSPNTWCWAMARYASEFSAARQRQVLESASDSIFSRGPHGSPFRYCVDWPHQRTGAAHPGLHAGH